VTLGPTKGGKSTFLRLITNMKGCYLSGVERETTHFGRFKE
jgi:ABC-type nitrate/sulfonate/bicarbonate transport system ATPase subunit